MVADDVRHSSEPEGGHLRQNPSFARNGIGHDDIEGGDPVRGHNEQPIIQIVHVPNLPPARHGQAGQ